eukprot:bmy_03626T0
MSRAAGVLRASGRVGAAGVYVFCLPLTLCPLQAACIPLRGGWPFTRVRVARSTARLDVLGPEPGDSGLADPGLGPGARSRGRRRMGAREAEGRKSRGFRAKAEITLPVVGLIFGGADPFPSFTPSQPLFTGPTFLLPLVCLLDAGLLARNYPAALPVIFVVPCVSAAPPYPPGPRSSLYAPSHYRLIPDQSEVALWLCSFSSRWRPSSVNLRFSLQKRPFIPVRKWISYYGLCCQHLIKKISNCFGLSDELAFVDADEGKLMGETVGLQHGSPFMKILNIFSSKVQEIILSLQTQHSDYHSRCRPDKEKHLDLIQRNVSMFKLMISIIGSGCNLATAPFHFLTGQRLGVHSESCHVPVWSGMNIAAVSPKVLNSDKGTDKDLSRRKMSAKIYLSVPCILGENVITDLIKVKLTSAEEARLKKGAETLWQIQKEHKF